MFGHRGTPSYGPDQPTKPDTDRTSGNTGSSSVHNSKGIRNRTIAAVFVRHGASDANQGEGGQELVRGQWDVPLNSDGRQEATQAGRTIARHGGASKVYSSPLSRGRDTAHAIGQATGANVQVTDQLLPWDKGDAEGKPIATEDPKLRRMAKDHRTRPVPGGESYDKFANRSDKAARSIVKAGKRSIESSGKPVAAVSHSVDMRRLGHAIEGKPEPDPLKGGVDPGGMMGVTVKGKVVKIKPGMWGSR